MCHNTHSPSRVPSWVNDMMTHIEPSRVSEFSTSGTGDDVSVFWEPDPDSYTDLFVLPAPSLQPLSGQNLKFPICASESQLLSHESRTRYGGAALKHLVRVITAMQNVEKKDSERKRKLDDDNINSDNSCNKENISPYHVPGLSPPGVPSTKHICRKKTGTEWQTVLDVITYGKEVLRSKPLS
ncbi:uncharacterized protein BJ212DRAFT_1299188 [Suillus subaureus]|uniref:Uncharacterized protein n=1 Tax=Suillus subaureus TaxID=48587 RepID=A0A9P7JEB8_9AGAM|nr:uncharacterized protein BJ212DRAFT_1299188 [Suillus subaureus]KAG1817671.1 hypothetical protein BJ212DRAFT_1299188 [Suillus subaureus]